MGTRPGQLDPGVVLYLIAEKGMSPAKVQDFLYRDCGLKGLSGVSNDMRELETQRRSARGVRDRLFRLPGRPQRRHAGGCAARASTPSCSPPASARTRSPSAPALPRRLAWLGVALDPAENAQARRQDLAIRQPRPRLRRAHRRRADDCAAHAGAAVGARDRSYQSRESVMNIPVFPETKVARSKGKKGLIVGIANDQSIAWGCAKAFRALGADLAVTYLNEKAKKHVEPLAKALEAPIFMPLDVMVRRPDGAGVRTHQEGMGPARLPASLDRLLAEGGAARARGRCRARRLPEDDGRVLLVVHAHGASRRTADEEVAAPCSR